MIHLLLTDGAWQFQTEAIDAAIELDASERDWYQKDMLNAFNRYAYYRYKQIRDCVNTRKCKHMTVNKVRANLKDEAKLAFTVRLLKISPEEINYIVDFADEHLEYIK